MNIRQVQEDSKGTRYSGAEQLLRQRVSEIEVGLHAPLAKHLSVAMLMDAVLIDYESNGKSVSSARYVNGHVRPFFGHMLAARVEPTHLQQNTLSSAARTA